jgi:hypothetical protein
MNPPLSDSARKPLVTVEFQTEVHVAAGDRQKRMFVKMYFDARVCNALKLSHFTDVKVSHSGLVLSSVLF